MRNEIIVCHDSVRNFDRKNKKNLNRIREKI